MDENTSTGPEWLDRELDLWRKLKPEPTSALLDLLCDKDKTIRWVAARELQVRGERVAFDRAVELSGGAKQDSREIAAFLLGQLGTPGFPFKDATVPILGRMLSDDPSPRVREAAAMGLGHLRATAALPCLVNRAGDPDPGVRGAVALALGCLGLPEAVAVLKSLCKDPDEEVRDCADRGLEILNVDDPDHQPDTAR